LREYPQQAKAWMSYGHVLKTANRERESIDAYLRSLELAPHLGEAWWSLANLKTFRFDDAQVDAMRAQLAATTSLPRTAIISTSQLGKALEDRREYAASFTHYSRGNALRRAGIAYDADELSADVRRTIEVFTAGMLGQRHGCGDPADDPIFIIGLPRAGSTLLEQVLSSHSQVEGTTELPDILALVRRAEWTTEAFRRAHVPGGARDAAGR
jgi:tetratricopeptide (TPR) repeat protein